MRKLKSLKGVNRRKTKIIELSDGVELPIRTLSVSEEIRYNLDSYIPMKYTDRRATQEEIDEFKAQDSNFNTKVVSMIRTFDLTNPEYQSKIKEFESLKTIMEVIKFVDMDYINEDGKTLWDDMGLKSGDWLAACRFFTNELCLNTKDIETIVHEIRGLRGESVFEKLARFEQVSGQSVVKILEYVSEGIHREKEVDDKFKLIEKEELSEEVSDKIKEIEVNAIKASTAKKSKKK